MRSKCCIIGVPDHQGVFHVGGRIGAAGGPTAFRRSFSRLKGKIPFGEFLKDLGDVKDLTADVALNHRKAADAVREGHRSHEFSVVIGGGHDHGFSHLLGVWEALQGSPRKRKEIRLGCINIDAHLDLRKPAPWITSGSPFYLTLESGIVTPKRFVEFGIQAHCNSPELWDYAKSKKVNVVPFPTLRHGKAPGAFRRCLKKLASICDAVVISLDLDALASAYAPGVSAPQVEGFTSMEVVEMMEEAGREKKVASLGIFELNPEHDRESQTANLAAVSAFHFVQSKLF